MARVFAKECGPPGVRCNALLPGLTKTKFATALFEHEEIYRRAMEQSPRGPRAAPQEMAGAALPPVSEAGSYINGESILADGGIFL